MVLVVGVVGERGGVVGYDTGAGDLVQGGERIGDRFFRDVQIGRGGDPSALVDEVFNRLLSGVGVADDRWG